MLAKQVQDEVEEMMELTSGWLREFSEPWLEACPC